MKRLCSFFAPVLLTLSAYAGFDVYRFPEKGEFTPFFPGVVKAAQLTTEGVLPTNGTTSIGEIAAKWSTDETNDWTCLVVSRHVGEITGVETNTLVWIDGAGLWDYGDGSITLAYSTGDGWQTYATGYYAQTNLDEKAMSINWLFPSGDYSLEMCFSREALSHRVPHATTNLLWSVTGSASTNFEENVFLENPAREWVRYGTATSGTAKLYYED